MKEMNWKAQAYILGTILAGIGLLVVSVVNQPVEEVGPITLLCILGSLSLILKVEGSTERSHYNISFLIYAFTFALLGPEAAIIVILVSNLAEWAWYRPVWYIPSFNITSHIVVMYLTGAIYHWVNPGDIIESWLGVASLLLAILFFTLANHLLVGLVIWLARGENFAKSGVFELLPLMLDFTMLSMGVATALIWVYNPFAIVLLLLPLYPIYSTLKVPQLERKTEIDLKTGLFNAKYFELAFQNELKRANRFDRPLTVVLGDLDLLRNINNTYGHLAGDQVLIGIANILKKAVREFDVVARFGGEEYAIMMPETRPEQAYTRVEELRKMIEQAEYNVPTSVTPIRATMSFGIAGRQDTEQEPNEIIHNADSALYHAKLKGRNGTYVYSNEGFVGLFQHEKPRVVDQPEEPGIDIPVGPLEIPYRANPMRDTTAVARSATSEGAVRAVRTAKMRPKWLVDVYIIAVAVISLMLYWLVFDPVEKLDWIGLAIFTLMVIVTEWLSIDIYDARGAVSTSMAPMLAGILLIGPVAAPVVSLSLATVAWIKNRSPINRFIFNFANQLIAATFYLELIELSGRQFVEYTPLLQFLISIGTAGIVYLITTSLISYGVSLDLDASIREIWMEKFSWLAPYYIGMGLIAYALVFSYLNAGVLGAIIVLIPLFLLRLSQMQYINRTKEVVQEIREKNLAVELSAVEIQRLNDALLNTLAEVIDLRDPHVMGHSKQVARYAVLVAKKLDLPDLQVELVRKAGLLHDLGKMGISESILFKPQLLTAPEYEIVKDHVKLGAVILESSPSLKSLIPIIRHHHERFDGRGYPDQIKGSTIPIEARILSVADAVEAMASDRPYRRAMTQEEILSELQEHAGTQFDPRIVTAFVELVRNQSEPLIINSARKPFLPQEMVKVELEESKQVH